MGQTDISDASDAMLRELLAETFGLLDLRSLNAERSNFPGLDLGDDRAGRAFQITADQRLTKILKTLTTSIQRDLHKRYPKIQVYVTTERQRRYKQSSIDRLLQGAIEFKAGRDILDYRSLLKLYKTFDLERLERIASILRKHLLTRPAPLVAEQADALERDIAARFQEVVARLLFPEVASQNPLRALAEELFNGAGTGVSQALRRRVLIFSARVAARRDYIEDAARYLDAASLLVGPDGELPALALLTESRGDAQAAIRLLRDRTDPDSVSTLIGILTRADGEAVTESWIASSGIGADRLTATGVVNLSQLYFRMARIEDVRVLLDAVANPMLEEAPYLTYLRGIVRVVSIFPKPEQSIVLGGIPLHLAFAEPVLDNGQLIERLDGAIEDLQQSLAAIRRLNVPIAQRIAEWYLCWAKLLHPLRSTVARERLRIELREPTVAVRRVQLAFKYLVPFDPEPLKAFLQGREKIGGLDDEDLVAALILRMHANDHAGIASLIANYRTRFQARLGSALALSLEIQALAFGGDAASARALLEANRSLFDPPSLAQHEAEIARAAGADPIDEYVRVYAEHQTVGALRILVEALKQRRQHRLLGPYAEKLYRETADPDDISDAAKAYAATGDDVEFQRVVESHPLALARSPALEQHYARLLVRAGRLREAIERAESLRARGDARYLELETAIAVDVGEWERLGPPLLAYWNDQHKYDARILIQAAQLALISGQGPFRELLQTAADRPDAGADVLLASYVMAIESGIDEDDAAAQRWFNRALALSDSEGPVQRLEIKDLLDKQIEWQRQSLRINEAITAGLLPLFAAAPALRMSIVEAFLGNFIRNLEQKDPRRRTAMPLFSGRRRVTAIGSIRRLGLDISSLLLLEFLGLLPRVLALVPEIAIPGGALRELFEGQRRARAFQKSQFTRAARVRALLASKLKVLRTPDAPSTALMNEAGAELGALLEAAQRAGGVVVRPSPVWRPGSSGKEVADLSAYAPYLADMRSLLTVLKAEGVLDRGTAESADTYFGIQDSGWETAAKPNIHRPLYIDEVAIAYLQTVRLLEVVVETFDEVYIHEDAAAAAISMEEVQRHATELVGHITNIRSAIAAAWREGRIIFGPYRANAVEENGSDASTLNLMSDVSAADVVVIDDRALNGEAIIASSAAGPVRVATTLDIIEELLQRNLISEVEHWALRHRLRAIGAALVPIEAEELRIAVLQSSGAESPEFRAISDAISIACWKQIPRFPAEMPWLLSLVQSIRVAIKKIWLHEADETKARALSTLVLGESINAADWVSLWKDGAPQDWVENMQQIMVAGLSFALELAAAPVRKAYFQWFDDEVLTSLRVLYPTERWAVVQRIRAYVLATIEPEA